VTVDACGWCPLAEEAISTYAPVPGAANWHRPPSPDTARPTCRPLGSIRVRHGSVLLEFRFRLAGQLRRPQFQRPSSTTVEGTSRVRTRKVSISTPTAMPMPICCICELPPATANTANVPASTSPAEVTASRNGSRCATSRIRVITRML
jgi:hypothetical protein